MTDPLFLDDDGPTVATERDAMDLVAESFHSGAQLIVLPVGRLTDDFFRLRTGIAGEIVQKFAVYRRKLAILGDISARVAASPTLRDFVAEANRGDQLWFVADREELAARLTSRSGR